MVYQWGTMTDKAPLKRPTKTQMQRQVAAWNRKYPEGTRVLYWPGVRAGQGLESTTYSEAEILGGHTAGVYVRGSGFVALTHVEAIEQ